FKLCSYLLAYEGWRRGLTLRWYKDESDKCYLHTMNSSTRGKFFSLSSNNKTHYFFRSRGDKVENNTVDICKNKERTKRLLLKGNIPTPLGKEFETKFIDQILSYANEIEYPVVIKPIAGSM